MHIGKKIRLARAVKEMTQQELADKIGKTRPLISQIESTGKVKIRTLKMICKVLDLDPDDPDFNAFFEESLPYTRSGKQKKEIAQLKDIKSLERENAALRELVEAQRDLIEQLKGKRKK